MYSKNKYFIQLLFVAFLFIGCSGVKKEEPSFQSSEALIQFLKDNNVNMESNLSMFLLLGETCSPCIEATKNLTRFIANSQNNNKVIICSECNDNDIEKYLKMDFRLIQKNQNEFDELGLFISKNFLFHIENRKIIKWWDISDQMVMEAKDYFSK